MMNLNDWKFRKFAILSLSLLIMLNGSIILGVLGIEIPFIRQIVGFLFLTFIPGYTLLKILKIHNIDNTKNLLFAIGLSLFYLMVTGLFVNIFYSTIGIKRPLELTPLLITFDIVYPLLLGLAYFRDEDYYEGGYKNKVKLENILNLHVLSLSFLPILAILGSYFFNFSGNSFFIIALFLILASIPFLVMFKKDEKYLTWTIWILSISLLYVSDFGTSWNYIWGNDINIEYYLSKTVLTNGFWNTSFYSKLNIMNVNAMLSIVILNPVYSIFLKLSPIMVFKIVYPFIFSLVPVGLYKAYYNIMTNKKECFLAIFFFISLLAFFLDMLALARQQIAEFYLMLLIFLLIEKEIKRKEKILLSTIFGFSIVVSHYGTTLLFLFSLILAGTIISALYRKEKRSPLFGMSYIILFAVVTIIWYSMISNSSILNRVTDIWNIILGQIHQLLSPKAQGFYLITAPLQGMHKIGKYIYLLTEGLIGIGILWLLFNFKKMKRNKEFGILCFIWFAFNVMGIVVPYFANTLNAVRFYQISLFFLAPLEIVGWLTFFNLLKVIKIQISKSTILRLFSIFLGIYLLFTSGVVYKIAEERPYYGYLDKNIEFTRWSNEEIVSGLWIEKYKGDNKIIYCDRNNIAMFLGIFGQPSALRSFSMNQDREFLQPNSPSYLFLSEWNIYNKKLDIVLPPHMEQHYISLNESIVSNSFILTDKIYSSHHAEYYFIF